MRVAVEDGGEAIFEEPDEDDEAEDKAGEGGMQQEAQREQTQPIC